MKYVLLFVVAIILVKIDMVIELGEKTVALVKGNQKDVDQFDGNSFVVRTDQNVRTTPRRQYLNLMDSFRDSPSFVYRQQAMELFKRHPQMFAEKLDRDLEARIYSWRDLIVQNSPEAPLFLIDLSNILKSENKLAVTRFFSVVLDLNIDMFMASYPRTKDPVCTPVTMIEAAVPQEARVGELNERLAALEEFAARTDVPADRKVYASTCASKLKAFIDKLAPAPAPTTTPADEAPVTPALPPTTP